MSFLRDYFDVIDGARETAVCCPFPHKNALGDYYETNPSAHVNISEKVFHCKACGAGHSELSLMQAVLECDYALAQKLSRCFENDEDDVAWVQTTQRTPELLAFAEQLGISKEVMEELQISSPSNNSLYFPVFMYNHLVDVRKYNPRQKPKVLSRARCPAGLILPFDIWRMTKPTKVTVICAGEKDMAVARSHGLNAITLTGGENTAPKILREFRGRSVVICYDNDGAGLSGAITVASALYGYAKSIKVVTGFHEVCKETGEDITDFFVKYGKTKEDLVEYFKNTPEFVPSPEVLNKAKAPLIIDLGTASKSDNVNRLVRSNIQVVAVSEANFITPTSICATKFRLTGTDDGMLLNESRDWELKEQNAKDLLHLIDNNFKEDTINQNIKNLLKIPLKEKYVKVSHLASKTVYKVYVTDMFEASASDVTPMEYTAYAIDVKLESGKKYMVTHKIVPHPYKGNQLTMIITDAVQASDSVSNFKVTEETKQLLDLFIEMPGTVEERIDQHVNCVKGILGYNGNNTLIKALDLAYHTVLNFNFGTFKNERGYLDTLVVGESRVGKSSTANALRETYGLGIFTSLAGNAATIPGLVGGSNKVNGSYQTRAGLIPQNHRGLIIFEEFGKSNNNIATELTDIRSSNEVRIARVSGSITMPAVVRMITLTNVKSSNGEIKPIASYPNGIAVIIELIGTAEDIARYDLMLVLSDRGNSQIDPFWEPTPPLPVENYRARVRWVWSRTPDQVIIDREVGMYIMSKANELNRAFDTHIKIFGTEAWKKLSRLSIAVAGYLMSTDNTYENLIVTKEHVDYAVKYLCEIYDNATFKLKEYVQHEKQYSVIDEDGVAVLQDLFIKVPSLLLHLEQSSKTSRAMLAAVTGLNNDELNKVLKRLTSGLFVRFSTYDIHPTERFRLGMYKISRTTAVRRVGETGA